MVLDQRRRYNAKPMLSCNRWHWIRYVPRCSFSSVIYRHDKWIRILQNKFLQSSGDALHCLLCKRALCPDSILFPNLLFGVKDTRTRERKINLCVCSYVRLFQSCCHLRRIFRCVCRFRPDDWLPVTSGNQEESLSHCRRTVVCRHKLPVTDGIAQIFQLLHKLAECVSLFRFNRVMPAV